MKKILLFTITAMLSLPAFAQWSIGLSGGYAYNHYDYDPQYMTGLDYKGHHGFAIDLPVNYQFNDWFGLSTGLSFQQKGYQMTGEYMKSDTLLVQFYPEVCRKDYYLSFPIMTRLSISVAQTNFRILAEAGGYAALWIYSHYNPIQVIDPMSWIGFKPIFVGWTNHPFVFNNRVDRRIELGLMGGLGIEYSFLERWSVFCVAHYQTSLTPQQKNYQIKHFPSRNITTTVQVGFMFNF